MPATAIAKQPINIVIAVFGIFLAAAHLRHFVRAAGVDHRAGTEENSDLKRRA